MATVYHNLTEKINIFVINHKPLLNNLLNIVKYFNSNFIYACSYNSLFLSQDN